MSNFISLRKWLKSSNDNLKMYKKGTRGIYCTKDIKEGDIIMKISPKYIIEFSKIYNKISEKLYNKNSYIATYLFIKANQSHSFWHTYLDSMPKDLNEYIYFYDKEKLKLLKNTSMMCKGTYNFNSHMKNIKSDSKIIYKWLLEKKLMPLKYKNYKDFFPVFLKYRILVCSRVFGYNKYNEEELGLVPYADLLNHSDKPNTKWYFDDDLDAFVVVATKDIKKNSEIYDSYGAKTNFELMLYYGFSIKNNPYSTLNFMIDDVLVEADHDSKLKELYSYGVSERTIKNKLKSILKDHESKMKKNNITDNNIINIYNDEVSIIKKLLS